MKEVSILSDADKNNLFAGLCGQCQLILPDNDDRLGMITFHIYRQDNEERPTSDECVFQIRWGFHKIFHQKHVKPAKNQKLIDILQTIIKEKCKEIRQSIINYCQEQLETFIAMELEPYINKQFGGSHEFKLGLCKSRKPHDVKRLNDWPNFCIFISWLDELGDFQEFLYPLSLNENKDYFNIPAEVVAREFRKYRDTII